MTTIMNRNDFITALEHNGISLDESRLAEVNYYWNLWCDTTKHAPTYNFKPFVAWMKKH